MVYQNIKINNRKTLTLGLQNRVWIKTPSFSDQLRSGEIVLTCCLVEGLQHTAESLLKLNRGEPLAWYTWLT